MPYTVKFKEWVRLLRAGINKHLPDGWEVAEIEEQYLYYSEGGKFEPHRDTHCNPLVDCRLGEDGQHPRLLTYLIYLNPDWKESDGGTFVIYEKWPEMVVQEVLKPELGKGIFFRADKVHHSAEWVNTFKRAITLFINIKKSPIQHSEQSIIRNTDMSDALQAEAQEVGRQAIMRHPNSETDIAD